MSVTIRLAKVGKRNAPSYKIVVSNTRDKRNGKYLDVLGHYNPSHNPPIYKMDKDKYNEWKGKGALSTDAVENLIEGSYEFKPYDPKHKKSDNKEVAAEDAEDSAESEKSSAAQEPQENESEDSAEKSEGSE